MTGSKLVLGNQECQNSRPCLGRDLRRHLILLVTLCWFSKCSLGALGVPKTCLVLYKIQRVFLVTLLLYLLVVLVARFVCVILPVAIPVAIVALIVILIVYKCRKKKRAKQAAQGKVQAEAQEPDKEIKEADHEQNDT